MRRANGIRVRFYFSEVGQLAHIEKLVPKLNSSTQQITHRDNLIAVLFIGGPNKQPLQGDRNTAVILKLEEEGRWSRLKLNMIRQPVLFACPRLATFRLIGIHTRCRAAGYEPLRRMGKASGMCLSVRRRGGDSLENNRAGVGAKQL